ncbi:MAG: 50S ribosomal protein L15 [Myxococcota bacterium]
MADALDKLKPVPGSVRDRKRVGRGHGSGTGKTAGRGHKGSGARAGYGVKRGFEGGQMPLQRRLPKRGFTNIFKKHFQVVNVGALASFEKGSVIDAIALAQSGLVRSGSLPVKVLGEGELKSAITVRARAFSASARAKIESAGGKAETV